MGELKVPGRGGGTFHDISFPREPAVRWLPLFVCTVLPTALCSALGSSSSGRSIGGRASGLGRAGSVLLEELKVLGSGGSVLGDDRDGVVDRLPASSLWAFRSVGGSRN